MPSWKVPGWVVPYPQRLCPQVLLLPPPHTSATLLAVADRAMHYGNRASAAPPLVSVAQL